MKSPHIDILNTLSNFEPTYLKDLAGSRLMNRVDTKFVFNTEHLNEILKALIPNYRILDVEGNRISTYESLYLDGEGFPFYLAHHNQHDHRFKVRFRKYVESGTVFLEVKEKRKGRTNKSRVEVTDFEEQLSQKSISFLEGYINTTPLFPSMVNTYDRITLVNQELNERATIDIGLKYMWSNENKKFANLAIAELKQERIDRSSPFYKLLKSKLIRPYQLSKYCVGIAELRKDEGLKYNRFKKKLRTIKKLNNAS